MGYFQLYSVRHKNTPKFIDDNLKTDDQILIIFGINISDINGRQFAVYVSASPNDLFLHYLEENKTSKILHFYLMQYHYLIQIMHI